MIVPTQQQRRPEPSDAARQRSSAVDLWIRRELQRSYDLTVAEPVPETLLRLLSCFPARH